MSVPQPLLRIGDSSDVVPGPGTRAELADMQRESGGKHEKRDTGESTDERLGAAANDFEGINEHVSSLRRP